MNSSSLGSASIGMGNLMPSLLFLRALAGLGVVGADGDRVDAELLEVLRTPCRRAGSCCMQWAHLPPRKKMHQDVLALVSRPATRAPVVSGFENGSAGKGLQTKGPSVLRSIRLMAVSSVPPALAG